MTGYGYDCAYGDSTDDANSRYVHAWDPNNCKRTLQYHASTYSIYGYSWQWVTTVTDQFSGGINETNNRFAAGSAPAARIPRLRGEPKAAAVK